MTNNTVNTTAQYYIEADARQTDRQTDIPPGKNHSALLMSCSTMELWALAECKPDLQQQQQQRSLYIIN